MDYYRDGKNEPLEHYVPRQQKPNLDFRFQEVLFLTRLQMPSNTAKSLFETGLTIIETRAILYIRYYGYCIQVYSHLPCRKEE